MTAVHTERAFEEAVAEHLVEHNYQRGDPADFDPTIALDTVQLFAYIEASQPRHWATLTKRHGEEQVRRLRASGCWGMRGSIKTCPASDTRRA